MTERRRRTPAGLHVRRSGAGVPLLLLHGLGGSGRYWNDVVERLDPSRFDVLAPDLLGFGRSPKPRHATYDVDTHLDALEPLVAPGTHLVGYSMGAILAIALARRHPREVRSITAIGLPAFPSDVVARAEIRRLGLLAELTVDRSVWGAIVCNVLCRLRPLTFLLAPVLTRDHPRMVARDGLLHTWTSYSASLIKVIVEHRVLPDLDVLQQPVQLLHGRGDQQAPLRYVDDAVRFAPATVRDHVTLKVFDGGHELALKRPAAVAEQIEGFVRSCMLGRVPTHSGIDAR